jgi:DNA-binding GntR family transcriptional regulator
MDYRTKEEQVADYLRERIISGVFPRGSRLKQAELAKELGLSITPVREALKLLAAEGYVSGDSYRGARVMPFDPSASAEILALRLLLESQLVRAAAEKITSADLEALRLLADEFAAAFKSNDRAVARGVNYRLHRLLYDVADLPQTLHFVQILWARYPFDVINGLTNRGDEAIKEHEAIFQALSSGDISAAIFCMRKHIESGWVRLRESNGC